MLALSNRSDRLPYLVYLEMLYTGDYAYCLATPTISHYLSYSTDSRLTELLML